jgi:hypothetical protein
MKTKLITMFVSGLSLLTYSQDTIQDPYLNIKSFTTFEVGMATTHTDSRNDELGNYDLVKGKNYPTINLGFFYTKTNLLKDPTFIMNIKTGLFLNNNYTDVTDSLGKALTFSEMNLTIPVMIGIRLPINYNRPQDRFYKAINLNIGGYVSLPMFPTLNENEQNLAETEEFTSDYIKFGLIAEFVYTALNKQGKGHRIGIRTITDIGSAITFSEEKYGIQPTYVSIGLFYNFITY